MLHEYHGTVATKADCLPEYMLVFTINPALKLGADAHFGDDKGEVSEPGTDNAVSKLM